MRSHGTVPAHLLEIRDPPSRGLCIRGSPTYYRWLMPPARLLSCSHQKSHCAYVPIADDHAVRTIGAGRLRGRSFSRAQNSFLSFLLAQ
jgi:hypothetical protein